MDARQHFCCRYSISNPGPVLDPSLKTTYTGYIFWIFCKNSKWACLVCFRVLKKRCFQGGFRHRIGPVTPKQFLLSQTTSYRMRVARVNLSSFLTNQDQITHDLCLDRSFSLVVRFPRAKTPKVCGAINVLSLDFPSVAG